VRQRCRLQGGLGVRILDELVVAGEQVFLLLLTGSIRQIVVRGVGGIARAIEGVNAPLG
jgi:hypothetical protein